VPSKSVRFIPEAEAELEQAATWYEERIVGRGGLFVRAVRDAVGLIAEEPDRWPLRPSGTRRYVMAGYPYLLFYRESKSLLEIVAVAHARRRPDYWRGR